MVKQQRAYKFLQDMSVALHYRPELTPFKDAWVVRRDAEDDKPAQILGLRFKARDTEINDQIVSLEVILQLSNMPSYAQMKYILSFSVESFGKYMSNQDLILNEVIQSFRANFKILPPSQLNRLLYSPE